MCKDLSKELDCLFAKNIFCFLFQLYASVLLKDPSTASKGRIFLERALAVDPGYTPGVFILIDAYEQVSPKYAMQ